MRKIKEDVFDIIEKPAHSFCEKCPKVDVRKLKDTLNTLYLTVSQLADYFNFEGKIENKCRKINEWVRHQQRMEMKNVTKNKKVSRKTISG